MIFIDDLNFWWVVFSWVCKDMNFILEFEIMFVVIDNCYICVVGVLVLGFLFMNCIFVLLYDYDEWLYEVVFFCGVDIYICLLFVFVSVFVLFSDS